MRKPISGSAALDRLESITDALKERVVSGYEHRAKSCLTCETPGACCLDAHFVNVHISRLEAVKINRTLTSLPGELQERVSQRIDDAIEKYSLTSTGDTYAQKFACPLFEPGTGCLVHDGGKPVPCIVHACYDDPSHMPPDELQTEAELAIDRLNTRVYGRSLPPLPLPIAITRS